MSLTGLQIVIERASSDPAFRAHLATGSASTLAGYDLTADEQAALLGGDPGTLGVLGLDQRVTKVLKSCGGEK